MLLSQWGVSYLPISIEHKRVKKEKGGNIELPPFFNPLAEIPPYLLAFFLAAIFCRWISWRFSTASSGSRVWNMR